MDSVSLWTADIKYRNTNPTMVLQKLKLATTNIYYTVQVTTERVTWWKQIQVDPSPSILTWIALPFAQWHLWSTHNDMLFQYHGWLNISPIRKQVKVDPAISQSIGLPPISLDWIWYVLITTVQWRSLVVPALFLFHQHFKSQGHVKY